MSVLIKGLNKPPSCGDCWFEYCDRWRNRNWGAKPPNDCPIVPVPSRGRWIPVDSEMDAFDCSECDAMVTRRYNYCPKCGAKMDGEQDE